ncbi:hypothetical protein JB92DRAFT_1246385 [Gautieria morchelliformis]|nr:hypothetical protein JB92DRAFT_1246385 [Gautieria morchelliformis]
MRESRLPRELIDAVTDNLHEDHDRDGLLACSLVCRSWVPSSQRRLFQRITFVLDGDDCERKAQTFLSSPHLFNYIRELKVHLRGDWAAWKQATLDQLEIFNDTSINCFQNLLTRGDQENDDEPRERICLSDLEIGDRSRLPIDWFLEPRSPFEISHIQTLRVVYSDEDDEKALNPLLRTIGSSLKHLEFYAPLSKQTPCE